MTRTKGSPKPVPYSIQNIRGTNYNPYSQVETDTDSDFAAVIAPSGTTSQDSTTKKKKKENTSKRFFVGMFVLAAYVLSLYMGTLYECLFIGILVWFMHFELKSLNRNLDKDERLITSDYLEVAIWCYFNYFCLPRGFLRRHMLEESGVTAKTHPLVFALLYEHHGLIVTFFTVVLFVWLVFELKEGTINYQLKRVAWVILISTYCMAVFSMQSYTA